MNKKVKLWITLISILILSVFFTTWQVIAQDIHNNPAGEIHFITSASPPAYLPYVVKPYPTTTASQTPTVTPTPTRPSFCKLTPTRSYVCTPPACPPGGHLVCGDVCGCPGGCGMVCLAPSTYTLTSIAATTQAHP